MYQVTSSFKGMPRFSKRGFAGFGQADLPCGDCPPAMHMGRYPTQTWGADSPPTKFELNPHWVPYGTGGPAEGWKAAQEKYRAINADIKSQILDKLQQGAGKPWGQEVQAIYDDLMGVDQWVRARGVGGAMHVGTISEEPDIVLYAAYRRAQKLVDGIAPGLTEQEEAQIIKALQPPAYTTVPTRAPANSQPMQTSSPTQSPYEEDFFIDEEFVPAASPSKTTLLVGGGAVLLILVGGYFLFK